MEPDVVISVKRSSCCLCNSRTDAELLYGSWKSHQQTARPHGLQEYKHLLFMCEFADLPFLAS